MDYNKLAREWFARLHQQQIKLAAAVKPPSTAGMSGAPANATLNPHPLGGVAAGANAALVDAVNVRAGNLTTAQQLAGGVPGLPPPGSLEYADYKQRGLL
jgi:hypothetical protein